MNTLEEKRKEVNRLKLIQSKIAKKIVRIENLPTTNRDVIKANREKRLFDLKMDYGLIYITIHSIIAQLIPINDVHKDLAIVGEQGIEVILDRNNKTYPIK